MRERQLSSADNLLMIVGIDDNFGAIVREDDTTETLPLTRLVEIA